MAAGHAQCAINRLEPAHIYKRKNTMHTKRIKGVEPLAIDKKVLAVAKKNASPWDAGDSYRIAICNDAGTVYRVIEADSLGIYVGLVQGLESLDLCNEVPVNRRMDGFDAIFRPDTRGSD